MIEGGAGVRFEVGRGDGRMGAFAVRFGGRVYAFVNRCAHVGVELDWMPGEFFDDSGLYLICATHGATYEPNTGRCVHGPCRGAYLEAVDVLEQGGNIYLK
ncbi:MAG: Rieske (2Fe-2S) protein [Hyphomicrobiaceae bacterium]